MSEWTRPAQPVRCVVELDKPLAVHRERGVLAQGDANANAVVAEVYSTAGKPYDLNGCTVQLVFVRPDNNALPAINAEISGNTATATLPDSAYTMSGMYSLRMQLRKNGAERTIVWIVGEVKGTDVDGIADPEHVISIGDIMASAKEAQNAASAANTAAERANAGAERVEKLQIDASGLAGDSNKLGGKAPEYYLSPENLLVNSYFLNAVNQRGQASYAGPVYGIDRWTANANDNIVSVKNGYVSYKNNGTANAFRQIIANASRFVGKTLTLAFECQMEESAICRAALAFINASGTAISSRNGSDVTNVRGVSVVSATVPEGTEYIYAQMNVRIAGGTVRMYWAALYESGYTAENLPPYTPKGYAAELAACQRYLHRFRSAEMLKTYCDDFCPPMRQTPEGVVSTFELTIDGVTYHFADAEL